MIVISAINQGGYSVQFDERFLSGPEQRAARVTRTKTLDGGSVIFHQGVRDADRTLNLKARVSEEDAGKLLDLFKNETVVSVSTKNGFFDGTISELSDQGGLVTLTILIKESV